MSKLKIVKDNNPKLRSKCEPVSLPLNSADKSLLNNMLDFLKLSQDEDYLKRHPKVKSGVGLAAPQVGVYKRMFCVYLKESEDTIYEFALVNPIILETSAKLACLNGGEGCLSVDKEYEGLVHRHYKIKLSAYDAVSDKNITITAEGYLAIILQHEYDHLDGILYYDRIDKFNPNGLRPNEIKI